MHSFRGVPGYPEGYSEPRHAYREELAAPLHARSLRRGAAAPAGAVELTPAWRMVLPEGGGEQLQTAVADFRRFMEVCMETPLEAGAGEAGEQALVLRLAPEEFETAEAYRMEAQPGQVTLTAGEESGLQYGLYELEDRMKEAGGPWLEAGAVSRAPFLETRILRSFFSPFYLNELLDEEDYYPDEYLNRLAHHRVNGVWIHVLLREIVPSEIFSGLGQDSERMLAKLRQVVAKAARYGMRVYLYFNEPRAFPQEDPFWERHPEARGARDNGWSKTYALCTSTPEVRAWLRESTERLFREVPELGGAFLITASEHHTNCFSHVGRGTGVEADTHFSARVNCPRCAQRRPAEVVCETVAAIAEGMHAAAPQAKVMAWDWSWAMLWGEEEAAAIVAGLPEDSILMGDFERGNEKTILGKTFFLDEYALSLTGPSQRFRRFCHQAQERGLEVYTKLQFVATHELANVPHTPLPGIVFDKFTGMQEIGVRGTLGCWIFGNYPGMITDLAGQAYFGASPEEREERLRRLAQRYFSGGRSEEVLKAWECFAEGWSYYPFHIPLLYDGPHPQGPGFPWYLEPVHRPVPPNYLAGQTPGDNLLHLIPDREVRWTEACFGALLEEWAQGLGHLEEAFAGAEQVSREEGREYGIARLVYHQLYSLRLLIRFCTEREWLLRSPEAETRRAILPRLAELIREELQNAEAALPYVEADSRLGWHSECFDYQYTPEALREKMANLKEMLEVTIPGWLESGGGLLEPQPYAEKLTDEVWPEMWEKLGEPDPRRGIFETDLPG